MKKKNVIAEASQSVFEKDASRTIDPSPKKEAASSASNKATIVLKPPVSAKTGSQTVAPEGGDSIVIKPKTSAKDQQSQPIVIQPRVKTGGAAAAPTPKIKEAEEQATAPAQQAPKKAPILNGISKPAASPTTSPQKQAARNPNGNQASFSQKHAEQKGTKKKVRRIGGSTITMLPSEDAAFDEALDDALDEIAPAEMQIEEIPVDEPEEISFHAAKQQPLRRKQPPKQKQTDANLSVMELVKQKSGLNEDDIAMIFELGYENELGKLVGYETLKKLRAEHLRRSSKSFKKHYRTAFGYRGEEYLGKHHTNQVMAAYLHDRKLLIYRLILTALCSLVLFFIDMPEMIGGMLLEFSQQYAFALPLVGMCLLGILVALSWRQLNAGARSLFRFSPTPYSLMAILLPAVACYDLMLLFSRAAFLPVNFLYSLTLLVSLIGDAFRISAEIRAFRFVSSDDPKIVLENASPRKKKLRQGNKIVKVISDDTGENQYRVQATEQTTGFFRRFNSMDSAARPAMILIGSMLSIAFLASLVSAILYASPSQAISAFMEILLLSAPLSFTFSFFYPLCRANKVLSKRSCTLLGEESVQEYQEPKIVIFNDTEFYNAEKCVDISVREGDDFRQDMKLAGMLFRKLGGPLSAIGEAAPQGREADLPISLVRIADFGVEAIADNRYHLLAGNADFLRRNGIKVPKESSDKELRRSEKCSLMYVVIDGILKLNYEIQYSVDASFEEMAELLADTNTAVAIQSYDPNLNEVFLQTSRSGCDAFVRVFKPGRFEKESVREVADTGAVALNNRTDITYPLYAATQIRAVRKKSIRMQLIASIGGGCVAILLMLLKHPIAFSISLIAFYQALWAILSLIFTHVAINPKTLHFPD